ncbi:helix-turn-helix domain-containing protein [Amycolatopsis sp. NPDC050768]|uniref:helix-turn-helix transcriptional regulator n=1 Tax=Amycolatopsis sp. NPDC050768 TaxID=3154839 RepID=UPI0033EE66F8
MVANHSSDKDELLTLAEVCQELKIARSTFYDWKAHGEAPAVHRLPNNKLRIKRTTLNAWLQSRMEEAA